MIFVLELCCCFCSLLGLRLVRSDKFLDLLDHSLRLLLVASRQLRLDVVQLLLQRRIYLCLLAILLAALQVVVSLEAFDVKVVALLLLFKRYVLKVVVVLSHKVVF